jgi:DNA-binding NarL/FixJ family response regulator
MDKIRVAIVDDQHLFRKAIADLLAGTEGFELLTDAGNGREFLETLAQLEHLPDIVLVDLDMPEMNGVELNEILHSRYPAIKTIILSVFNQERFISRMIDAGANGYLEKNCSIEELVTAVNTVHKTGFYFNAACINALRHASSHRSKKITNVNNIEFDLTPREHEILELICTECTNVEIADKLFISVRTVEGHRNNLLLKVGCRNTAGLVTFAITRGIFKPWLG